MGNKLSGSTPYSTNLKSRSPSVCLIGLRRIGSDGSTTKTSSYRVDVATGKSKVVVRGLPGVMGWAADGSGTVRAGFGYDDGRRSARLLYRPQGSTSDFHVLEKADERKGESLLHPFLFLPNGDHALVIDDNAKGMSSIYDVDLTLTANNSQTFFEPSSGEVEDLVMSHDGATLLGVSTSAVTAGTHWFQNLQSCNRSSTRRYPHRCAFGSRA
jgi:hypothetical protein